MPSKIVIGDNDLSLTDLTSVLMEGTKIILSSSGLQRVEKSFNFLKSFCKGKLIYGINTGFGPMAQYKIEDEDLNQLQYNLIRSHSSGLGNLLSPTETKALMICRLSNFMKGFSGIHPELVILLEEMINRDLNPCIYEHGGVGASGDLVQLAHLALALIGEGEILYKGKIENASDVFKKENLKPLTIHFREGIALLNGTSAMTGISILNLIKAKNLLNTSVLLSSTINQLVGAFDDSFSVELNIVKNHPGQIKIAESIRNHCKDSSLIKKRHDYLYKSENLTVNVFKEKVQEYYSIRCVPQILGPVLDTIENAEKVIINEVNSVNDNPVIDHINENVFHGGNFHGDYVSLEMDKLKISITKLSMLCERQLNYLLNDKLNQKLPPFINLGKLGVNYGMQGMQFTATSTVAECQSLSMPMYIHSIPNNNDNQDIVSMGTNAAVIARKVIDNSFEVMAIHSVAIMQAVDYLELDKVLSPSCKEIYKKIRAVCPKITEDRPHFKILREVTELLKNLKF